MPLVTGPSPFVLQGQPLSLSGTQGHKTQQGDLARLHSRKFAFQQGALLQDQERLHKGSERLSLKLLNFGAKSITDSHRGNNLAGVFNSAP